MFFFRDAFGKIDGSSEEKCTAVWPTVLLMLNLNGPSGSIWD